MKEDVRFTQPAAPFGAAGCAYPLALSRSYFIKERFTHV
jgi:hypothetical protein